MRIKYKKWKPNFISNKIIKLANSILESYAERGYSLSLRQLYYQFVARGVFANHERNYKKLGDVVTKGRDAGLLSWDSIVDRGRVIRKVPTFNSQKEFADSVIRNYLTDWWRDQESTVQVWVEKDALSSVVWNACSEWNVPFVACKGYMSASAMWSIARDILTNGKQCIIIHLGDHDPSGIDMTRDIEERLRVYSSPLPEEERPGIEVRRIALNMDQIKKIEPIPNPTKVSDPRADWYLNEYGESSWELDALEPEYIESLIADEIRDCLTNESLFLKRKREDERVQQEIYLKLSV